MTDESDKAGRVRQSVTAALLAALLCLSANAQQQTITGKVVGVSDGETITVLDASNQQHKIRLIGIDAPEINNESSNLYFGGNVQRIYGGAPATEPYASPSVLADGSDAAERVV
jgi:endonuclease YncB( thermonuclease family)